MTYPLKVPPVKPLASPVSAAAAVLDDAISAGAALRMEFGSSCPLVPECSGLSRRGQRVRHVMRYDRRLRLRALSRTAMIFAIKAVLTPC